MMNLYYRCHLIHEDIRSICYTIFGSRPQRSELSHSTTLMEAMHWVDQQVARQAAVHWVDQQVARQAAVHWVDRDSTRQKAPGRTRSSQIAIL